jgi:GDP-L-fucose synthase
MNILITGRNGFIGKELSEFFTKMDHTVFSTCRKTLDVSKEDKVNTFFQKYKVDVVLHTAIKGGKRTSKDTINDLVENLIMFQNLFEHRGKYKLMISFGSGAECKAESYYGISKRVIAQEIEEHDKNVVNMRLYGCFGPTEEDTRFIKSCINQVLDNKQMVVHQNKYMDYFYIEDLKKVVLFYIENYNMSLPNALDLCYADKVTLLDIANQIKNLTKSDLDVILQQDAMGIPYIGSSRALSSLNLKMCGLEKGIEDTLNTLKNIA